MALIRRLFNEIKPNITKNGVAALFSQRTSLINNIKPAVLLNSCSHLHTEPQTKLISSDVIQKVNEQIKQNQDGRLFAVVHIAGKQFKVTEGDVIIVEGHWPPDVGDQINLDKVLMIGASDFTIFGKPLVERGLVNVYATVIEKTLSHTKTHFKKKRRKQYMRINFCRIHQTMLRINSVKINQAIDLPID